MSRRTTRCEPCTACSRRPADGHHPANEHSPHRAPAEELRGGQEPPASEVGGTIGDRCQARALRQACSGADRGGRLLHSGVLRDHAGVHTKRCAVNFSELGVCRGPMSSSR
jgi:hypothetical protein